ncbi:MAG TPA: VCBS repeat-containing protein [Planctomycetes bacterium]|nr:VCBS repeat-containing protein [Planctomycetota bacterium]
MGCGGRRRAVVLVRALVAGLVVGGVVAIWLGWPWGRRVEGERLLAQARAHAAAGRLSPEMERRVERFCSDCHGLPDPENYPRDTWRKGVERGYEFYAKSGREDLDPPPMGWAISYFKSRAPAELVLPRPGVATEPLDAEFAVDKLAIDPWGELPPGISFLRWVHLEAGRGPVLVGCDMRQGAVGVIDPVVRPRRRRLLARLNQPGHAEPCDLDGDGLLDLVVADLGSFYPDDHDLGRVVWLRGVEGVGPSEPTVLASGLGRVADVRPVDADGDGALDLLVAEFGADRTGGILLLRNVAGAGQRPRYQARELDARPGTIHLCPDDLNGDGLVDFVALVSQEYECVEAFINRGGGEFGRYTLWAGPDPAFGSSGIELVDLDQDGDQDILYTNGDSFDDGRLKPCHGVQWLENLGDLRFAYHRLVNLPGAYRALAGDVDQDGDLDVVVSVWVAPQAQFMNPGSGPLASIVCLEQRQRGRFVPHTLEEGFPYHAAMEMADFDGDGDLDFVVGSHSVESTRQLPHWLSIWWNRRQ